VGIIKVFSARESLVSEIPVGDEKTINLFLQCIVSWGRSLVTYTFSKGLWKKADKLGFFESEF
jgi:hypothetical protein